MLVVHAGGPGSSGPSGGRRRCGPGHRLRPTRTACRRPCRSPAPRRPARSSAATSRGTCPSSCPSPRGSPCRPGRCPDAELADERQAAGGVHRAAVAGRPPVLVPLQLARRHVERGEVAGVATSTCRRRRGEPAPIAAERAGDLRGLRDLLERSRPVRHPARDDRVVLRAVRARRPVHHLERRHDVLRRVVRVVRATDLVRLAVGRGRRRERDVRVGLRDVAVGARAAVRCRAC